MSIHPICLVLSIAVLTSTASHAELVIWANNGEDKVTQDDCRATADAEAVHNSCWDGSQISIFGARNEVLGFSLYLEAPVTAATQVTVSFDTLKHPQGYVLVNQPASGDELFDWTRRQIELFYVRYLQIKGLSDLSYESYYDERHIPERMRRPWTGEGVGSGTWEDRPDHDKYYPDIAVPIELEQGFSIAQGKSQAIWVDVYIPSDAPPGLYSGNVIITEGAAQTHILPVVLEVVDMTLPDMPTAKTMLYISHENIYNRHFGQKWIADGTAEADTAQEVMNRYFMMLHRHRVSVITSYGENDQSPAGYWTPLLDGSLFTAANGYAGPGTNTGNNVYSIGTYGGWGWDNTQASFRKHADAWVNWFETNNRCTCSHRADNRISFGPER